MLAVFFATLAAAVPQPTIVQKPIPFPKVRKEQMAAYSRRHYGIDSYRLRNPKVIVEHYTVTSSFQPVWNTFAANTRDSELGELPGTCAHYVIDRDGKIYQLVPRSIMCRHTVGLNYTCVRDRARRVQRRAGDGQCTPAGGLAAAHALAALPLRDRDRQRHRPQREPLLALPPRARGRLRDQTHGDFTASTMRTYRSKLVAKGTC